MTSTNRSNCMVDSDDVTETDGVIRAWNSPHVTPFAAATADRRTTNENTSRPNDQPSDHSTDNTNTTTILWQQLYVAAQQQLSSPNTTTTRSRHHNNRTTTTLSATLLQRFAGGRNRPSRSIHEPLIPWTAAPTTTHQHPRTINEDHPILSMAMTQFQKFMTKPDHGMISNTKLQQENLTELREAPDDVVESKDDDDDDEPQVLRCIIQALLLNTPTIYDLTWKLSCQLIQHGLLSLSSSSSRFSTTRREQFQWNILTDVQSFLHQVSTSWWDEEQKAASSQQPPQRPLSRHPHNPTSADWILELLQAVMTNAIFVLPERHDSDGMKDQDDHDRIWIMTLQVLSTMVTICGDVDDNHDDNDNDEPLLLDQALDRLFPPQLLPTVKNHQYYSSQSVRRWIQLAANPNVHVRLRTKDWDVLYDACDRFLHSDHPVAAPYSYPAMLKHLWTISIWHQHWSSTKEEEHDDEENQVYKDEMMTTANSNVVTTTMLYHHQKWHQLMVQLFFNMKLTMQQHDSDGARKPVATILKIYGQMEHTMYTCLSSLSSHHMIPSHHPTRFLQRWMTGLVATVTFADESVPSSQQRLVVAELLLLIRHVAVQQQSESFPFVSHLMALTFRSNATPRFPLVRPRRTKPLMLHHDTKITGPRLPRECWDYLLQMVVPPHFRQCLEPTTNRSTPHVAFTTKMWPRRLLPQSGEDYDAIRQHYHSMCSMAAIVEQMFANVVYSGRGQFTATTTTTTCTEPCDEMTADTTAESLSIISQNILQCLFVGPHSDRPYRYESDVLLDDDMNVKIPERVHHWIQCIANIATELSATSASAGDGVENYLDGIVAVVVWVTIFFELPTVRTAVAQTILELLSQCTTTASDYKGHPTRTICTTALSVILSLSSSSKNRAPYPELDVIPKLLSQPIPLTCFCDIALAVSSLPSARSILLSSRPKDYTRPQHEAIRCHLYSLMLLIQQSLWKDYDNEAWVVLSDIIVVNSLDLPITIRVWILQELKDAVRNKRFHRDMVTKLLRAGVVRLIHFLGNTNGQETSFSESKAKRNEKPDEIIGLFDLVFTLLHCCNAEDDCVDSDSRSIVFKRCLFMFPELIGLSPHQEDQRDDNQMNDSDCLPKLTRECVDSNFLHIATFCCLAVAFDVTGHKSYSIDGISLPSLLEIKNKLREEERTEIGGPDLVSLWVNATNAQCNISRDPTNNVKGYTNISKRIRRSLCDVVALLFTGPDSWLSDDIISDEGTDSNRFAFQMASVLGMKLRITYAIDDETESTLYSCLESRSLVRSVVCFCSNVVPTMQENIRILKGFEETNEMLSVTVNLCERLSVKSIKTAVVVTMAQYLQCLRNIYDAVIQEESVVKLIKYLETCCSNGKLVLDNMSMELPDDIACFVRRLRTSFFQCLSRRLVDIHTVGPFYYDQHLFYRVGRSVSFPLESITMYIEGITKDLTFGLSDGKSGGLTHDVYVSMIDTLEKCAQLASYSSMPYVSLQTLSLSSVALILDCASNALKQILCNFAINHANAFKKTLMLCTATLPSVQRLIRINDLSVIDDFAGHEEAACSARQFFDQLVGILKRKSELDHLEVTTWELIAGKDHLGGRIHISDSDDEVSELSDGFADVVKCEREPLTMELDHGIATKILLRSERSWTWSLCCVMEAFEQDWSDSSLFMSNNSKLGLETNLEPYFELRQSELKESLEGVCQLFKNAPVTTRTLPHQSDYVLHLPAPAKLRLCSLVDVIVNALKKSIKILIDVVHSKSEGLNHYLSIRSNLEAFSCLYAWLTLCTETDQSDLWHGLQRWRITEKSLSQTTARGANEKSVDGSSSLRQLPNLICRVEEVEKLLQKLSHAVPVCDKKKKGYDEQIRHKFVQEINILITDVIVDSPRFDELLSNKVSHLEMEQSTLRSEFGLTDNDKTLQGKKRKGTNTISKVLQRERRRRIVRSRNFVVDTWLQADRVTGDDASIDNDAYADLEDFLVDG